jgi:hypothetical protein
MASELPPPLERLQNYLTDNRLSYKAFAEKLAVNKKPSSESIRMVVKGYRGPGWALAFAIEVETGISAHDLKDAYLKRSAA